MCNDIWHLISMQMNYSHQAERVREQKSMNPGKVASMPSPWVSPLTVFLSPAESPLQKVAGLSLIRLLCSVQKGGTWSCTADYTCFSLRQSALLTYPSSQERRTEYESLAERPRELKDKAKY